MPSLPETFAWYHTKILRTVLSRAGRSGEAAFGRVARLARYRSWFSLLEPIERLILNRRVVGQTLSAIGRMRGWSRQYIQQIEQRAVQKLGRFAAVQRQRTRHRDTSN